MSMAYLTKPPVSVSEPSASTRCPAPTTRATPQGPFRLFDSKYVGIFNTHMECVAFVKGVEVVLNYMLEAKDVNLKPAPNRMLEAKEFEIPAK